MRSEITFGERVFDQCRFGGRPAPSRSLGNPPLLGGLGIDRRQQLLQLDRPLPTMTRGISFPTSNPWAWAQDLNTDRRGHKSKGLSGIVHRHSGYADIHFSQLRGKVPAMTQTVRVGLCGPGFEAKSMPIFQAHGNAELVSGSRLSTGPAKKLRANGPSSSGPST